MECQLAVTRAAPLSRPGKFYATMVPNTVDFLQEAFQ